MYVLETNSLFLNFVFSNQVGGQEKIRRLWQHYYQGSDGLIFVVDSSDRERIDEAREELHGILSWGDMSNVPIVIIANKQDLPSEFNYKSIFLFSKTLYS
jgi:small GTP-binding protein